MPLTIVAGNWKMNTSLSEAVALARDVRTLAPTAEGLTVVLFPPFPYLHPVKQALEGSPIALGAQDVHFAAKGAYTGEVSPAMLAELCRFVLVGHSERRQHAGETDELVNKKLNAVLAHGLRPILCVGETQEQRRLSEAIETVRGQLERALQGVKSLDGTAIAYEPVWAVGTGVAATPEAAREVMEGAMLRTLAALFGEHQAADTPLLYGGSVSAANVEGFAELDCVHGVLVGGVSLNAREFAQIARTVARAKGLL
ncbi:MAG: triose-phosphate isomerase [Dehalococcoidia bacterium]|nr:triose-phosphate isomerase [Dehalococcoidia bacterium]